MCKVADPMIEAVSPRVVSFCSLSHLCRRLPESDQGGGARLVRYPDQAFGFVDKECVSGLSDTGPAAVAVVV